MRPSHRYGSTAAPLLAVLVASTLSRAAVAAPLPELLGAPTGAHPFNAAVASPGAEAAYFNPALLVDSDPGLTLGFVLLWSDLAIGLDPRPDGVDVPGTIYDLRELLDDGSTRRLVDRPLPTASLREARRSTRDRDALTYLELGLVQPIVAGRLAVGLYGTLPTAAVQVQRPYFVDEREQYFSNRLHFELYGDRLRTQAFHFGLGARPLPWLSLGAGLSLGTRSVARTDVYIGDSLYQEESLVVSDVTVEATLTPSFALAVTPIEPLRLALTLHLSSGHDVDGRSDVQFWTFPYPDDGDSVVQRFAFRHGDQPLRLGFGAHWAATAGDLRWNVAATGRLIRWSAYQNRQADRPRQAFRDTVTWGLGGGVAWSGHRVGLDLLWAPTPVPEQVGRDNYVDNDRVGASLTWGVGLPVGDATLRAGLTLGVQRLVPRSVRKDLDAADPVRDELPRAVDIRSGELAPEAEGLQTNNPGFPGFASRGWLVSAGLRIGLTL